VEPPPHVDVEARRLLQELQDELAFADLVRRAFGEPEPAPVAAPEAEVPIVALRVAAVAALVLGTALVVAGFLVHTGVGLLTLFLLPAFVLTAVLAVEQVALLRSDR
jgi:hypothetical protein